MSYLDGAVAPNILLVLDNVCLSTPFVPLWIKSILNNKILGQPSPELTLPDHLHLVKYV